MARRKRRKRAASTKRPRHSVELNITYKGCHFDKDDAIRKALAPYDVGSGFMLSTNTRDHQAEVDPKKLAAVIRKLKKIPGITIKKLTRKWVPVQ